MKILMLSNCPILEHQGSGYVIHNTFKTFLRLGHKVKLIPPSAFSVFPKIFSQRAKIYRMIFGMALWVIRNKKEIRNYDMIIFYGAESFLALFFLKKIFRIKANVILHSNGLEIHVGKRLNSYGNNFDMNPSKWYHWDLSNFWIYCYRNVDAIITVSKYDRDFAVNELQLNPDKVFHNEPALPEIFFSSENSGTMPERDKIITYCGTWISRKGVKSMEIAIPQVLRKNPEYVFRIIGVGENFIVEKHFPTDILDRIEVYPLISEKTDLIKQYYNSSIFLFPSFCESFGLVVAEAMFCKCAVITGPTGFAASIIKEKEAIVLDVPGPLEVTTALEKLIFNDNFRKTLGIFARKKTQNLNWFRYSQKMKYILKNIIKNRHLNPKLHIPYQLK